MNRCAVDQGKAWREIVISRATDHSSSNQTAFYAFPPVSIRSNATKRTSLSICFRFDVLVSIPSLAIWLRSAQSPPKHTRIDSGGGGEKDSSEVSSVAKKFKTCYKKAMKHPRLIVGILAVAHLVLAVVAICFEHFFHGWIGFALFMLFPSQGSLIAIWAALGRRPALRVALACIGIVVCFRITNVPYFPYYEAIQLMAIETASIIAMLLLFRLTGLEMTSVPLEPWESKPFQFTIWQIITWTATVAVVMSALHYFPDDPLRLSSFRELPSLLAIVVSLGIVALMSIWLVFGKKWLLLRVLGVLAAIGTGTWILDLNFNMNWWHFVTLLALEAAWTILSLLVVRWAGNRMTWHWRLRRFKESSKANAG